ncbi:site-specific integrase [Acinetobacter bereziniae]|uniref:tyrosine-type recombinase/integrase n=1 Tax=Acinetobacter bereziniae TaxID=106648 RepID=UPI001907EB4B|nr:site-specific integrase [Acinetobacter bereziniae]MDP6000436.1 site-specific integrase [Acinetobacter bereziniae]QQC79820.1 site-specific integrase [Acinetobacter bereziniae]UUN92905.1 site-specific integrase [Acinetobacter bereziniae]WMW73971.1 site-specific integrase [Acinetobacter bereziniae]
MGNKSESYFSKSKAHINFITEYRPTYFNSASDSFDQMGSIYCPRFPSLIKSDNTVWHLASAYFNHLLIDQRKSTALLESVASDLIDFLRFLENTELDILYLPPKPEKRVTYQFHTSLLQRIRLGLISPSTARQRMNRILRFYDFLISENVFTSEELKNRPYEKIRTYVSCISATGDVYKKQVDTSNLKIRHSPRPSYGDEIIDGGRLHPLSMIEQQIFLKYLEQYGSRDFQLICYMALYTGARLQSICTLRAFHIKELLTKQMPNSVDDTYSIRIGGKSIIDTKGGYEHNLKVPAWLIQDIDQYLSSESWKQRASQSLYKVEDENYVFLTKHGNPYYTSIKEIEDRNLQLFSKKIKFSIHRGNAARQALTKLINLMHKNKEDIKTFTLHDLRATFGVNLLLSASKHVNDIDKILPYIQSRMGHRNIMSTIHYVRYIAYSKSNAEVDKKFEEILFDYQGIN